MCIYTLSNIRTLSILIIESVTMYSVSDEICKLQVEIPGKMISV